MPKETLFPHLTSTGPAPTYIEVLSTYRRVFHERVAEGKLRPLVLPYHFYGCFLLLTYLYIPHTKSPLVYAARWPILACIAWFQWKTTWETSSDEQAVAFVAGLTAAWGAVWSFTWLVLYRPQWDAKRVQRKVRGGQTVKEARDKIESVEANRGPAKEGSTNGSPNIKNGFRDTPDLRQRTHPNGTTKTESTREPVQTTEQAEAYMDEAEARDGVIYDYFWQSCPSNLSERIPWTMDLLMNFRGPGWNWAIPSLPALPPFVKAKLGEPVDEASKSGISSVGIRRFNTREAVFNYRVPQLILGYFVLDLIKTIVVKDPYFVFGPNTYALPPHLAGLTTFQLNLYRQFLIAFAVVIALQMVFMLAPLGLCLLAGPAVLGLQGEAWYYPPTWGPFSNILNKGLSGLWGGWWHQTFRFAFAAPTNYLIEKGIVKPHSKEAKFCALFFAFGISGLLHAAGSVSQVAFTHPWQPPIFFMLQALGILVQTTVCTFLRPQISQLPKIIRQAGNLAFTWTWLWYTGWLLVDDFARGGLWLWEPVPISPMRALGYGSVDDSWWCWGDIGVRWYSGKHWWDSGISI